MAQAVSGFFISTGAEKYYTIIKNVAKIWATLTHSGKVLLSRSAAYRF
jgi:hypothetical protein